MNRVHPSVPYLPLILSFLVSFSSFILPGSMSAQQVNLWRMVDNTWNRTYVTDGIDYPHAGSITALSSGTGLDRIVLHSTDRGITWQTALSLPFGTDRVRFNAIAHPTDDLMVVVGDSAVFIAYDEFFNSKDKYWGTLTLSRDGGVTWEQQGLDSNTRLLDVDMYDGIHGIASLQTIGNVNYPDPSAAGDYLLYTDDAWHTHRRIALPTGFTYVPQAVCLSPTTFLVEGYFPPSPGFVMMRTTDRGETWTESEGFRPELIGFNFLDSLNGWGAGGVLTGVGDTRTDLVAHTTDGGRSWETIMNEGHGASQFGLDAIDFADAQNGICVGTGNKILRTTDGGATWRQEAVPSELQQGGLRLAAYPEPDLAVVFSGSGPIIRYSGEKGLAAPYFLKPKNPGPLPIDSVLVEWSGVEGAVRYRVEVTPDPIGNGLPSNDPPLPVMVDSVLEGRSIVLRDLIYWHRYLVRVKAIGENVESDWWNHEGSALFYTMKQGSTPPPVILSPEHQAVGVPIPITVRWQSVPEALSYDFQAGENQYFLPDPVIKEEGLTDTFLTFSVPAGERIWYIRVRANFESGPGDWSSRYAPHLFRTTGSLGVPGEGRNGRGNAAVLSLVPNPVRDRLNLTLERRGKSGPCTVALYGQGGRLIRTLQEKGETIRIRIETGDLPPGAYRISVTDEEGIVASEGFVVAR